MPSTTCIVISVLSPVPQIAGRSRCLTIVTLYYDPTNPSGSVINPNTDTQIRIQSISAQDSLCKWRCVR